MTMRYRDIRYKSPGPGAELPAFIVSEYSGGDLLLFSHGGFDIWCVYHAIKMNGSRHQSQPSREMYPLKLETIKIGELTGTKTDFTGNFNTPLSIEYDSRALQYKFDAPEDVEYMQDMRDLAMTYGKDRVWESFMTLYDSIPHVRGVGITRSMTKVVMDIASDYPREANLRLSLDCLLCAMIAENNRLKRYGSRYDTRLGKKVKALGVYQAVYETNMTIRQVADYSKFKPWKWISDECRKRGISTPDFT